LVSISILQHSSSNFDDVIRGSLDSSFALYFPQTRRHNYFSQHVSYVKCRPKETCLDNEVLAIWKYMLALVALALKSNRWETLLFIGIDKITMCIKELCYYSTTSPIKDKARCMWWWNKTEYMPVMMRMTRSKVCQTWKDIDQYCYMIIVRNIDKTLCRHAAGHHILCSKLLWEIW